MTLTVLKSSGSLFCIMLLYWNFSGIFLPNSTEDKGFQEENHRGKEPFLSYHTKGTYSLLYLSLLTLTFIIWLRSCLSGFCNIKLVLPQLPHYIVWKEVTRLNSCLKIKELLSISLRIDELHQLFGILLHGGCLFSITYLYQ